MARCRVAHFLRFPKLFMAPWNEALMKAYLELDCEIDLFAGHGPANTSEFGERFRWHTVEFGRRWLLRNALSPRWRRYGLFSGTSEDPLGVVGGLSALHRRPSIAVSDEIYSGSYRSDAPEAWKNFCRRAMRRASLNIVMDEVRIPLLRDYAGLDATQPVAVFPSGFDTVPAPVDRDEQRRAWGVPDGAIVIGLSGGFNLTAGADWLIESVTTPGRFAVVQPLGLDPFADYLMGRIEGRERIHVDRRNFDWRGWWSQAAAFDIGVAVYLNPAPQFQSMGKSSNRLCMCLAMGVPVIASRQDSFRFIEDYDCGVLVDDSAGFSAAIDHIRERLPEMRVNALRCWREHIATPRYYAELRDAVARVIAH